MHMFEPHAISLIRFKKGKLVDYGRPTSRSVFSTGSHTLNMTYYVTFSAQRVFNLKCFSVSVRETSPTPVCSGVFQTCAIINSSYLLVKTKNVLHN